MSSRLKLDELVGFEWDKGNSNKNKIKHGIEDREAEETFSNKPLIIFEDKTHSQKEERWGTFGITNEGKRLAVYITVRKSKIRIISARDQSQKERLVYMTAESNQKMKVR